MGAPRAAAPRSSSSKKEKKNLPKTDTSIRESLAIPEPRICLNGDYRRKEDIGG
jgi:hypothetical protein